MTHHLPTATGANRTRPGRFSATVGLGLSALLALGLAGCSGSAAGAGSAATSATTGASAASPAPTRVTASPSATDSEAGPSEGPSVPAATSSPLPDPVRTVAKVVRGTSTPKPSVSATTVPFGKPVTYADGVVLTIASVGKGRETGHGPGAFPGRQYVTFDLVLKNGSKAAIDLNTVVLTAFYGPTRQRATGVYAPETKAVDFSGSVAPGASAKARYAFALPDSGMAKATLVVDFDGAHTSATYTGTVSAS